MPIRCTIEVRNGYLDSCPESVLQGQCLKRKDQRPRIFARRFGLEAALTSPNTQSFQMLNGLT